MAPSTMSLARALTKRARRNHDNSSMPTREGSVRYPTGTIKRDLISLPTELISTTNVHALSAPDIGSIVIASSDSSIHSSNGSDFSHMDRSFLDTPTTSPDTSSIECSPLADESSKTTNFFDAIPKRSATTSASRSSSASSSLDAPAIPQRALSHSKKAHQALARKRSQSQMTPPPNTLASSTIIRNSADIFGGASDADHPFSKELAQVNEVAEEFGAFKAILVKEEQELLSHGFLKFSVDDYLDEISGLYGGVFEGKLGPMSKPWI